MKNKYEYTVYIGRFQPFHLGHFDTVLKALDISDNLIIVLGSHKVSRNIKNPWTCQERKELIESNLTPEQLKRVHFSFVEDRLYQEQEWVKRVQDSVHNITKHSTSVCVIGTEKDDSTYYIQNFRNWKRMPISVFTKNIDGNPISSTKIRELLFTGDLSYVESNVPPATYKWLREFSKTEIFETLKEEYEHAIEYEKMFQQFPYAVNFVTTDAVVVQSGHILLIRRKEAPGKGLWALPGGHLNADETLEDGVIRELKEESSINIQEEVLKRCIVHSKTFDHPERSLRARLTGKKGRTITKAFCIRLNDSKDLPRVKGSDDADKAWWFPIAQVSNMRDQLFEDHADIIDYFISRL